MSDLDEIKNCLTLKLVYYGPALSGKTTNLTRLHDLLHRDVKGQVMVLDTKNDRTLFFDMLPVGIRAPSGLLIKIKIFTVPGQVAHDSTRKAVLSRADGIIFVADSQINQSENNLFSFENLVSNCNKLGMDIEKIPLVIQFNKRDLSKIVTEQEINQRWQTTPWPVYFSNALAGNGVIETFTGLLSSLYQYTDKHYQLLETHGLDNKTFLSAITGSCK